MDVIFLNWKLMYAKNILIMSGSVFVLLIPSSFELESSQKCCRYSDKFLIFFHVCYGMSIENISLMCF